MNEIIVEFFTTIVSLLTLIALAIYTYFTFKYWGESKLQTRLSISPFIFIRFDQKTKTMYAKNSGNGLAVNVKINDFELYPEKGIKWSLSFDKINYIESKGEGRLICTGLVDDKKNEGMDNLLIQYLTDAKMRKYSGEIKLHINYQDAIGNSYKTELMSGINELEILKISIT